MKTDDCRVRDGSGPYGPVLFEVSAYDRMISVIRDMSESDCRFQSSMIRGVIYAKIFEKGIARGGRQPFLDRSQAGRTPISAEEAGA